MTVLFRMRSGVKIYDTGQTRIEALNGVDIEFHAGEMAAVMGPSGCGKTTLLNCMSGLDSLSSGRIDFEGEDLSSMNDDQRTELRASRMGFVFQTFNLLPVLSASENVELRLLLNGVSALEARDRALEALDAVGLAEWATHRPSELSGGQKQRVTLARSLVHGPSVIFADEPTGALDQATGQAMLRMLRRLNESTGVSIIVVTHDPEIAQHCPRQLRMEDGMIVEDRLTHPLDPSEEA